MYAYVYARINIPTTYTWYKMQNGILTIYVHVYKKKKTFQYHVVCEYQVQKYLTLQYSVL